MVIFPFKGKKRAFTKYNISIFSGHGVLFPRIFPSLFIHLHLAMYVDNVWWFIKCAWNNLPFSSLIAIYSYFQNNSIGSTTLLIAILNTWTKSQIIVHLPAASWHFKTQMLMIGNCNCAIKLSLELLPGYILVAMRIFC